MNEEDIKKIAREVAQDVYDMNSTADQFAASTTPFHKHNGQDSPTLPFTNLADVPLSYYQQKGRSVIVGPSEKLLEFSGGVLALTATDGFITLPTCAGTPTGTPGVGVGALVLDTTAGKIWAYYGGAWHFTSLT